MSCRLAGSSRPLLVAKHPHCCTFAPTTASITPNGGTCTSALMLQPVRHQAFYEHRCSIRSTQSAYAGCTRRSQQRHRTSRKSEERWLLLYHKGFRAALIKTGQCFALNGLIFLGSILLWDFALSPGIRSLLQISLEAQSSQHYVTAIHALLCAVFRAIWLVPVYMVSFPLSCVWYQEIAELAFRVSEAQAGKQKARLVGDAQQPLKSPQQQQDVTVQIAQELYRAGLFVVFFLQTYAVSFVPWLGFLANFVLLSWLNALYSFDYKWSLTKRSLQERMHVFEHHWAFFAGFGSVCTLATIRCPFFSGAALLAMLYPLFILIACDTDPLWHYKQVAESEKAAGRELTRLRLPIFGLAIQVTSWMIAHGGELLRAPEVLWRYRWPVAAGVLAASCAVVAVSYL